MKIIMWNKIKFSKDWSEEQHLIFTGNKFQRVGATTEKAQSPNVDKVRGITSKCLSEDRSVPCKDFHERIPNMVMTFQKIDSFYFILWNFEPVVCSLHTTVTWYKVLEWIPSLILFNLMKIHFFTIASIIWHFQVFLILGSVFHFFIIFLIQIL